MNTPDKLDRVVQPSIITRPSGGLTLRIPIIRVRALAGQLPRPIKIGRCSLWDRAELLAAVKTEAA